MELGDERVLRVEVSPDEAGVLEAFRELIGDPTRQHREDVGFLRLFGGPCEPSAPRDDRRMPFGLNWPEAAIGLRGLFLGGLIGDAFATTVEGSSLDALLRSFAAGGLATTRIGATSASGRRSLLFAEAMVRGHVARRRGGCDLQELLDDTDRRALRVERRQATAATDGWLAADPDVLAPHPVDPAFLADCQAKLAGRTSPAKSSATNVLTHAGMLALAWDNAVDPRPPELLVGFGELLAERTHAAAEEALACGALAALVRQGETQHPFSRIVGMLDFLMKAYPGREPVVTAMHRAVELESEHRADPARGVAALVELVDPATALGALVIGTFAADHALGQRSVDRFSAAMALSVLHDGDRRASAMVCGQLIGMFAGPGVLPRPWLDQLDLRDVAACLTEDVLAELGPEPPRTEEWYHRYPLPGEVVEEPAVLPREVRVVVERLRGAAAADSGAGRSPWDLALVRRAFGRSGDGFCEPVKGSAPRLGDVALVHGVRAHFGASVRAAAAADRLARGGAGTSAPVGMLVFCLDALVRAETRQRTEGIVDPRGTALFGLLRWRHALGVPWERVAPGAAEPGGWLPSRAVAPGDPDPVCEGALAEFAAGGGTLRRPVNRARSSSAMLRALGLATWSDEPGEVFAQAVANALLTHGHPDAFLSAGAFGTTAQVLLAGGDLDDAVAVVADELSSWPGHEDVRRALDGTAPHGDGAAPDVLAVALGAARERFDDAEAAVRRAIELNPAAAPLVGAMLAASRGEPDGWRVDASLRDVLDRLTADVVATRVGSPDRRWDQSWVADYPAT
ncbi:ADP-ribosylglycohydrolase family protein [Saccharopolyspora sp. CA-218241]|uniref:ADP-ribosylglycohydrolase family protein n=1 Tax=Saccharopolyspora sp. CA-218241 TaxID=3240027 RepID=UPI003D990BB5